jgi:hypothetical protein
MLLHQALTAYLLAAMGTFYAQENHNAEPSDVTEERYEAFADDVAFAVEQPYIQPVFADKDPIIGRAKTALLLVSIAVDESHFREDVIRCGPPTKDAPGDNGKSWGPFQTTRAKARTCASVAGASGVAIEMIQESFRICRGHNVLAWLAEYTDGRSFNTSRATKRSALKMGRMMNYWNAHPFVAPNEE